MSRGAIPVADALSSPHHHVAATQMNVRTALREAIVRLESESVPSAALAAELLAAARPAARSHLDLRASLKRRSAATSGNAISHSSRAAPRERRCNI
jgi:hypothetical protein